MYVSFFQFRGAYRRLIGRDAILLQHVPNSNIIPEDEGYEYEALSQPIIQAASPSGFTSDVVGYMAGFVARKVHKKMCCDDCDSKLFADDGNPCPNDLINLRDRGGLVRPSKPVIRICQQTEIAFKKLTECDLSRRNLLNRIRMTVLCEIPDCFPDDHDSGLNSHALQLTKAIIDCYSTVRLYHLAKEKTDQVQGHKLRSKLSKTILFLHQ